MTSVDQPLIDAAMDLARSRFPTGEAVAAALKTKSGRILTSVWIEARVDAANLCAETGAICEAHKFDDPVVASVCVSRLSERDPFEILPACGICQERLAYWGLGVQIAVPSEEGNGGWQAKTLHELRPHYWAGQSPEAPQD